MKSLAGNPGDAALPARSRLGAAGRSRTTRPLCKNRKAVEKSAQRDAFDDRLQVLKLGALRTQKAPARRCIEEEVADFERGTGRMRRWPGRSELATIAFDRECTRGFPMPRDESQPGYGRNARQSLATETERSNAIKVIETLDLARGVAGKRQRELRRRNADSIVADTDQMRAACLDFYVDSRRAGIETVLEQFLDD